MLHGLRSAGHALPLTLSISPILLEQLADTVIAKHFMVWLDQWRERAAADLAQFQADGDTHAAYLAQFYIDWIIAVEQNFVERFGRNLAAALRSFVRDPVEVLLAPATYAYLPQLSPTAAASQLEAGAMVVLRHLGRRPRGIWLPGGRPSAIQTVAGELGVHYMVGQPWFQSITTEMQGALPTIHPSQTLANHVIAPGVGYPADGLYREFYRDHPASGIAYWRVTGAAVPAEVKAGTIRI
jgi:1,4-alpha-glucan branching enzyme